MYMHSIHIGPFGFEVIMQKFVDKYSTFIAY